MSLLYFDIDEIKAQCDMNYSNYSENGVNYVPCRYRSPGITKALPYLLKYLGLRESDIGRMVESRFGRILIKAENDELILWISTDAMQMGFSTGEVARQVALVTRGLLLCLE